MRAENSNCKKIKNKIKYYNTTVQYWGCYKRFVCESRTPSGQKPFLDKDSADKTKQPLI